MTKYGGTVGTWAACGEPASPGRGRSTAASTAPACATMAESACIDALRAGSR